MNVLNAPQEHPQAKLTLRERLPSFSDVGRLLRFGFFAALAIGGIALGSSSDWSMFNTPLAQLTLWMIVIAAGKILLLLGGSTIWFLWAFGSSPDYDSWGRSGLIVIAIARTCAVPRGRRTRCPHRGGRGPGRESAPARSARCWGCLPHP